MVSKLGIMQIKIKSQYLLLDEDAKICAHEDPYKKECFDCGAFQILCLEVAELYSLYIYIYNFCAVILFSLFFFYKQLNQIFLFNTTLHTVVWFQVFLSNANNYLKPYGFK